MVLSLSGVTLFFFYELLAFLYLETNNAGRLSFIKMNQSSDESDEYFSLEPSLKVFQALKTHCSC